LRRLQHACVSANGPDPARTDDGSREDDEPLPAVAGYRLLRLLGRGGMGVVYQAQQLGLQRLVALKMIRVGKAVEAGSRSRFRTESRAVARLHHPNIVQIFEVGEAGAVPYYSMEYVDGRSLADQLAGLPQPEADAAGVVELLARAVQYAHEQGVVHRDLKPSNILLTAHGAPKIADFGLAKVLDGDAAGSAGTTAGDVILGTPSYMAPEQVRAPDGRHRIGSATDVYALGAILYEMLTGMAPFTAKSSLDTVLQVLHTEPTPPRRFRPALSRDLETICLKCLAKDPVRRFGTAAELAEDLRRFRAGEPIRSRPVSRAERLWRWSCRNPVVAALALTLAVVLLGSLSVVTWKWQAEVEAGQQARLQKQQADEARREAERLAARLLIDQAIMQGDHNQVDRALLSLVQGMERARNAGAGDLEHAIRLNLNAWRWQHSRPRALLRHADWVWAVAYSPDSQLCATASRDKTARIWRTATGELIGEPLRHQFPVWSLAFSPDGRQLLTGSGDSNDDQGEVNLFEVPSGKLLKTAKAGFVFKVAFHPDGRTFLVLRGESAHIWKTGNFSAPGALSLPHPARVTDATLSPDGSRVLTGGADATARLWETATGRAIGPPLQHDEGIEPAPGRRCEVTALAFSTDGKNILTGTRVVDKGQKRLLPTEVCLWSAETGARIGQPWPHAGPLKTVLFSPDGRRALTAGLVVDRQSPPGEATKLELSGEARLWDVATGQPIGPAMKQSLPIWSAALSPDGRTILTGSEAGQTQFWVSATGLPIGSPRPTLGNVNAVLFSPDGQTALTSRTYENAAATLWQVPQGPGDVVPSVRVPGGIRSLAVHPRGTILATAGADGQVQLWDRSTAQRVGPPLLHQAGIRAIVFNSTGTLLATVGEDHAAVWEVATRTRTHDLPHAPDDHVLSAAFSPDGTTLITGTNTWSVRLWDPASGKPLGAPLRQIGAVTTAAFHPDGKSFVVGTAAGIVQLYDLKTRRPRGGPLSREPSVRALAFSPDGKLLASATEDQTVWLWDVAGGKPVHAPLQHQGTLATVAFSADGQLLVTGAEDGAARLWDVATGLRVGPMLMHRGGVWAAVPPHGNQLLTFAEDGLLRHWDLPVPTAGEWGEIQAWVEEFTHRRLVDPHILSDRNRDH
jgi:WD40 repeat protein